MEELQKLLDQANEPSSENRLSLANLKDWLAEYIEMRDEESARFPDHAHANHWDLIAADYDASEQASFVAAYFAGDQVTFLCGCGPVVDVRSFAQDTFPDSPENVLDDLARRFSIRGRWTTNVEAVVAWAQGR